MKFGNDSIDTKGIEGIIKLLKENDSRIRIGVLGSDSNRKDNGEEAVDNATIGMWHELGNEIVPARSWLRMPLTTRLFKKLKSSGAVERKTFEKIVKEKSFLKFFKKVGMVGVECIQDAFNSEGFGEWKPSNMKGKKVHQTLVETQQLRNSVTSEVKS